jgi:hypothetical protein
MISAAKGLMGRYRGLMAGLAAMLMVLAPPPSFGQAGWREMLPPLTDKDIDLAARTAREDMTARVVGTRLKWHNADSGNRGSVELLDRFERDQHECRTVRHDIEVKDSGPWAQTLTICRQADGEWQAAPPRRQAP